MRIFVETKISAAEISRLPDSSSVDPPQQKMSFSVFLEIVIGSDDPLRHRDMETRDMRLLGRAETSGSEI